MRVAVTGAAGYLGTNLVNELVNQDHPVVAIDRIMPTGEPAAGVTWIEADVLDLAQMTAALEGVEVVYHLVAVITLKHKDPLAWRINTEGVATVADAALAADVRRMVHCSSLHSFNQADYGDILNESSARATADSGLPVYDRSKWAGEQELHQRIDAGLDAVICNPSGIYGGADHSDRLSRLNQMVYDAACGKVPLSVASGFDLVAVRDVAIGLTLAAAKGMTGENYILAGEMVALHRLMKLAAQAAGKRGPLFPVPLWVLKAIMPLAEPIGRLAGSDVMSRAALGALFTGSSQSGV